MPLTYDLPNYLAALALIPAAAVTADGNGSPFDLALYEGNILISVDIGATATGTTPTLALVIKESADNSNWSNSTTALTGATSNLAAAQVVAYDTRAHLRYMRIDKDIGGANSPSYPISVVGFAQKQYNPS